MLAILQYFWYNYGVSCFYKGDKMNFAFFFNNILLGVGLAMDAFSVAVANGLNQSCINKKRTCLVAGTFAFFQFIMPFLGWVLVATATSIFAQLQRFIPYVAFVLLCFIGGKMLLEGIKNKNNFVCKPTLSFVALLGQGVATSIDALSVGFTISLYTLTQALIACLLIGVVTFFICLAGVIIGKTFGSKLAGKAGILGGVILIFIAVLNLF